ncbi:hypothetical protein BHE74_00023523 [Ensete ventricosum]|nr:hypothetical protein BHE74_00023523 [Ensete ventricosum]RZR84210.1 hypothetical protein BHM03_00010977 [Ensete ventricosum]
MGRRKKSTTTSWSYRSNFTRGHRERLLFKESSNFHRLRVGVTDQRMHYIVSRFGLFLRSFIFEFEVFFRWYDVLILY